VQRFEGNHYVELAVLERKRTDVSCDDFLVRVSGPELARVILIIVDTNYALSERLKEG
jgi:hypothetical protein